MTDKTLPGADPGANLEPLQEPRIRPTTRRVMYLPDLAPGKPSFQTFGKPTEADKRAVVEILRRIRAGEPLDQFYRSGIDDGDDELLEKYGILHLHLEHKGSKHLLYLVQYEHPDGDYVVLLEINDHKHVKKPVGELMRRHLPGLKKHRKEAIAAAVTMTTTHGVATGVQVIHVHGPTGRLVEVVRVKRRKMIYRKPPE
ncbi:hypothetical protein CRT60_01060 [Azospirillum palustre]|uniref:Uncharacterized protein n=1 Tax=Azospirillum palustre TaxID=2044885 RepID=A0A2B8BMS9_9PROT|nr:hypothetical protein [Azospirillum palustre]PGH59251.1 hypothetical protein CRT60_01060 [Azospirillum palustre]